MFKVCHHAFPLDVGRGQGDSGGNGDQHLRATWLLEAGIYADELLPVLEEIRQGMNAEVIPYQFLKKGAGPIIVAGSPMRANSCVIGYGTYPFARQILIHHSWVPGAWCSDVNLDCESYYPHFARFLLNQNYTILPGIDAIRDCDSLFSTFGRDNRVFIRPTSCHKLFVGRCVDADAFSSALAPSRYDPTTKVVIAEPQQIEREWRLVVVGDRVVSGSQYAANGVRAITSDCPREVSSFAESMLAEVVWRPDAVFMLDVCQSFGRLRLVELNMSASTQSRPVSSTAK